VPLLQAVYHHSIELHQTQDWTDKTYSIYKDPLWNTVKQSQGFDDVWFYHCDHLGTPQEMSNQTGAIIWKAQYKAWGECKVEQAKSDFFENSEIISNNIRFQGQYFDGETGLHYNRYRYYSPYVGRFISKDPIGLLGGYNLYQYGPSPVGWIDPLGLMSEWQRNWEAVHGKLPEGYQVHHIIPKNTASVTAARKLCSSFDEHNIDNLIALPKDANVPQKTGAGFGKTTHYGYHAGYNEAATAAIGVASRMKSGLSGCKRLAVIQAALKKQLQVGGQTIYGNQHPNGTAGVEKDWKNTVRNHVRGK
jgi:RHS repeat-associated protein